MAGCQTVLASPLLLCNSDCCLYKKILCVRIPTPPTHTHTPSPTLASGAFCCTGNGFALELYQAETAFCFLLKLRSGLRSVCALFTGQ